MKRKEENDVKDEDGVVLNESVLSKLSVAFSEYSLVVQNANLIKIESVEVREIEDDQFGLQQNFTNSGIGET